MAVKEVKLNEAVELQAYEANGINDIFINDGDSTSDFISVKASRANEFIAKLDALYKEYDIHNASPVQAQSIKKYGQEEIDYLTKYGISKKQLKKALKALDVFEKLHNEHEDGDELHEAAIQKKSIKKLAKSIGFNIEAMPHILNMWLAERLKRKKAILEDSDKWLQMYGAKLYNTIIKDLGIILKTPTPTGNQIKTAFNAVAYYHSWKLRGPIDPLNCIPRPVQDFTKMLGLSGLGIPNILMEWHELYVRALETQKSEEKPEGLLMIFSWNGLFK